MAYLVRVFLFLQEYHSCTYCSKEKQIELPLFCCLLRYVVRDAYFIIFNEAEYEIVRNYANEAGCCSGLWNSLSPCGGKLSTIDVLLVLCSLGWLPPLFHGV